MCKLALNFNKPLPIISKDWTTQQRVEVLRYKHRFLSELKKMNCRVLVAIFQREAWIMDDNRNLRVFIQLFVKP